MANEKKMTKAEYIAARADLLAEAEKQASLYNQASDVTAANTAENAAKTAIKAANDYSLRVFLLDCIESAEGKTGLEFQQAVVFEACRRLVYQTHSVKLSAATDDVKTMEITVSEKVVDLTKFNRTVLSAWFYRAELLTDMLTRETAKGIGYSGQRLADAMQFFKLSKEAAEAEKISRTTLKKVLPEIIGAMIGESYKGKVLPVDVNYLLDKFVIGGKSMTVKVSSIKQVCAILTDIAHRAITDGSYTIVGKELKAPKNAAK